MSDYVPLSKTVHSKSGLVSADCSFALEQTLVPVVAEELPQVVPTMAIGFVQSVNGKSFELVALQSLQAGVNVYVHTSGQWIGGYRPAWYRAHPFRLLKGKQSNRYVVCVNEASPAFEKNASEQAVRLFDDEGNLTQRTQGITGFLEKLQKATAVTQALVRQLGDAGVVAPWPLTTRRSAKEEGQKIEGLYHIDEAALRALNPDVLGQLVGSGALSVAYAQLLSEHRLQGLSRLYGLRSEANQQVKSASDVDLEDLFGEDDDDLSFNF
ncbi:SapC family protein [Marinobacter sp. ANT_B65]|uniref:SapC family protein n=1 Tax=Marinobacter sp. ANT_B65 TaxID=2039467 RepID=UPI000BBE5F1F|nr:SapC family protein [Marinobacter sp. ANT_B65]PCM45255.1 hypothetical protein CPA50_04375 [Marinobacter sp. ANT_B65]